MRTLKLFLALAALVFLSVGLPSSQAQVQVPREKVLPARPPSPQKAQTLKVGEDLRYDLAGTDARLIDVYAVTYITATRQYQVSVSVNKGKQTITFRSYHPTFQDAMVMAEFMGVNIPKGKINFIWTKLTSLPGGEHHVVDIMWMSLRR